MSKCESYKKNVHKVANTSPAQIHTHLSNYNKGIWDEEDYISPSVSEYAYTQSQLTDSKHTTTIKTGKRFFLPTVVGSEENVQETSKNIEMPSFSKD